MKFKLLALAVFAFASSLGSIQVMHPKDLKKKLKNDGFIKASLGNFGHIMYGSSILGRVYYPLNNTDGCRPYRNEDFPAEDLSLWLRLGKEGKLVSVPKILLKYRLVESSVSVKKRKLIQDKTRILLGKIGINTKDYLFVKNNIEDILERYDQFEFAERRKLLLLTELFSISFNPKKYGISAQSSTNNLIDLKLFLNFQFPAEIIRLRKEKYSRDMIRKLASIEK